MALPYLLAVGYLHEERPMIGAGAVFCDTANTTKMNTNVLFGLSSLTTGDFFQFPFIRHVFCNDKTSYLLDHCNIICKKRTAVTSVTIETADVY